MLKRPATHFGHCGMENKPNYMKQTFATQKQSKSVQNLASLLGGLRNLNRSTVQGPSAEDRVLQSLDPNTQSLKPTRRQQQVDEKIERILVAYKRKDEITH